MASNVCLDSVTDYTVAWVAPTPIERAAATAMFDEIHSLPNDFKQVNTDPNVYTIGRIGSHNIVIASFASGIYGNTSATATALNLLAAFPCIRFGLLVGIGAGIPNRQHDIRLGDVVISQPTESSGGVFQYDHGKILNGKWERKGCLAPPPQILLKGLAYLQSQHELGQSRLQEYLEDAFRRNQKWAKKFKYPEDESDRLFKSSYHHVEDILNLDCSACMESGEIIRSLRDSRDLEFHCGIIGSGNTLVKDAKIRDAIALMEHQCICLEMEAAGLMDNFPCLVIRGISDYADSHKNDAWQRYAAAAAAAVAKGLLEGIAGSEVCYTPKASDILLKINSTIGSMSSKVDKMNLQMTGMHEVISRNEDRQEQDQYTNVFQALYTCPYAERKDRNIQRISGTYEWFISHPRFLYWREVELSSLLWVSADPGCGKSVLARHLIDSVLPNPDKKSMICYFFFKDDFLDQRSAAGAISSLLHQMFHRRPDLIIQEVQEQFNLYGNKINESFTILWDILLTTIRNLSDEVIFVLDALDECRETDRSALVQAIARLDFESTGRGRAKWLVTSRPYNDVQRDFKEIEDRLPIIHLSGEGEQEVDKISEEITLVIKHRVKLISTDNSLTIDESTFLEDQLTSIPHRTYLWVHLTMDVINNIPGFSRGTVRQVVKEVPKSVNEAYEKILSRTSDERKARRILGIVVAALQPLSTDDMSVAMTITDQHHSHSNLDEDLEQPLRMQMIIREACGLFVTIIDGKIYLLHQTAREFLVPPNGPEEKNQVNIGINSHSSEITPRLHWQHSFEQQRFDRFLAVATIRFLRLGGGTHNHPSFEKYAMRTWVEHFQRAQFQAGDPLIQLFLFKGRHLNGKFWYDVFEQELRNSGRASDDFKPAHNASLLTLAAWAGHVPLVKVLTRLGDNNNLSSPDRRGPLWWASYYGHYAIIELLVHADANLYGDDEIQSSLEVAASRDHVDVFRLLWKFLPRDTRSDPLFAVIKSGNVGLLKTLVIQGFIPDTNGNKSLFWLARRPNFNPDMIKFVVSKFTVLHIERFIHKMQHDFPEHSWSIHYHARKLLTHLFVEAVSAGNIVMTEALYREVHKQMVRSNNSTPLIWLWTATLHAYDTPIEIHSLIQLASYRLNADMLRLLLKFETKSRWAEVEGRSSSLYLALHGNREHYEKGLEENAIDKSENRVEIGRLDNSSRFFERYKIPLLSQSSNKDYEDAQRDVVKLLLAAGAIPARSSIRKKDYVRWTSEGKTWIIEAFMEAGYDINSTRRLQLPNIFKRSRP